MSGDEDPAGEVDAIADALAGQHMEYFAANPMGQLVQNCLAWLPNGEAASIVCGWRDAAERSYVLMRLREFFAAEGVTRYAIWAEVWVVVAPVPEGVSRKDAERAFGDNYQVGDLSKNPERKECVFTFVADASGVTANRLQEIKRGRNGGVKALLTMPGSDGLAGALATLLPPRVLN